MDRRRSGRRLLKGAAAAGVFTAGPAVIVRADWLETGPIKIRVLERLRGRVKYVGNKRCA